MKILVVTSTFPASDDDPVPAFVKDQIKALKKTHPEISFLVLAPHDARSQTRDFSKHTTYEEYRFHYAWPRRFEKLAGRGILPQLKKNPFYYLIVPLLFIGEWFALKQLTQREKPDFIYAHWFTPQGIVGGMVGERFGIPVTITTHASDVAVWHKVPLGSRIVKKYSSRAHRVTAVSHRTMAKLSAFLSPTERQALSEKAAIIPMGIDIGEQTTSPHSQTPPRNILFIGRLAEKKGVQYLIPAFAKIVNQYPGVSLTIAGDGPLLSSLQDSAKRLKVDINFCGFVSGSVKQTLLQDADIFVVPSIITKDGDAEGLPVSLMEGLAAGKICIATNESGADHILTDGKDGYLITHKNIDQLANALSSALSLETSQRKRLEINAVKTAGQFSWNKVAADTYNFLFGD